MPGAGKTTAALLRGGFTKSNRPPLRLTFDDGCIRACGRTIIILFAKAENVPHTKYTTFRWIFQFSSIMRNKMIDARKSVGHIHYYSKDTALASIADSGQEIIDYFYTAGAMKLGEKKKLRTNLMNIPRQMLYALNEDLTVKLLGGYSLLVLAK